MSVTVVDASALAAVLFDEPESEPIVASISGSLVAPSLLPYEIASVCSAKLSMRSADAKAILSRYGLLLDLDIELTEPDWQRLPMLARAWSLSAYDAAPATRARLQRAARHARCRSQRLTTRRRTNAAAGE